MPRTPTYGRAAGPGDAVGSSIYELYAPQRESTAFGVDYAKTGYQLQKEVEEEKQRQLDAKIAQNKRIRDLQEQEAEKRRAKGRRGKKVGTAAAGAYTGAKWGAAGGVPGSIVGGLIGGVGGWLFGEDGGMVPSIHPDSLLYKQYQNGGTITGYSGGRPKFLRRGYQNLQLREEDVERAQENLESVKAYNFWDAIGDIGAGLDVGKSLSAYIPGIQAFMKDIPQYGLGDAFKHSVARGGELSDFFGDETTKKYQDVMKENVTRLGMAQNPLIDWENYYSTEGGFGDVLEGEVWGSARGGYVPTPARKSIYRDRARSTKYLK